MQGPASHLDRANASCNQGGHPGWSGSRRRREPATPSSGDLSEFDTLCRLDGRLSRDDRAMAASVAAVFLLLVCLDSIGTSVALGTTALGWAAAFLAWGFAIGRSEPACIVLREAGLSLIRSRERRQDAEWHLFEEVRLTPCGGSHATLRWRLTLVNRFKPSIGSFLHTRSADRVIFYFPLDLEFDAPADTAGMIRDLLTRKVGMSPRHRPPRFPPPRLEPPASRPDYSFEGFLKSARGG